MSFNIIENELIQSEQIYVNELNVLISTYVEPLEKYLATVTDRKEHIQSSQQSSFFLMEKVIFQEGIDIISVLFANVRSILSCNTILLSAMRAAAASLDSTEMYPAVDVLLKHMPFIKMYTNYASNFERSNALLTRLETGDVR